jgi:tRNA dimethylallyltransferase
MIALVGQTATGKSALGLALAQQLGGEVIAADSRTIYRGLDIGTAKPHGEHLSVSKPSCGCTYVVDGVVHHLIDRLDVTERSQVALFKTMAKRCLASCVERGVVPLLVGGTGQYCDSILYPTVMAHGAPDEHIRLRVAGLSLAEQVAELKRRDPVTAATLDTKNPRRVARALEIVMTNGIRVQVQPEQPMVAALTFGLTLPSTSLWSRIEQRIDEQLQSGLEHEVSDVVQRYGWGVPGLETIGYREWQPYFLGEATLAETRLRLIYHTRQYAKRQATWFKRHGDIAWFLANQDSFAQILEHSKRFLKN